MNIAKIQISMDENDEIELVLDGEPLVLATVLVCGLSKAAEEIYPKLPEASRKVFVEEIAELAYTPDPANEEEEGGE